MLHDVGMVGLASTMTKVNVEVGSDVVVLGCGPVGLSAVQGARIQGAAQIIAVEPIKYRRDLALRVGATVALDPDVEGDNLVPKIRQLCQSRTRALDRAREAFHAAADRTTVAAVIVLAS